MIPFLYCLLALNLTGDPVTFLQDSRVKTLVKKHAEFNKTAPINGFRINIFFQSGNHSRSGAMASKNAFFERFPDMDSYVSFEEPYFRVNVGNFRTHLEAAAVLEQLKVIYPQAFVIRDVLDVMDLLKIESEDRDNPNF